MSTLETLEEQRDDVMEQINKIRSREDAVRSHALVGRAFVYRGNCYSCPDKPEDYWAVFYYVTGTSDGFGVDTIQLQSPKKESLEIKYDHGMMTQQVERLEEITVPEFEVELMCAIDRLRELHENL